MHKQLCNRYIVDPSTRQTDLSERNEFRSFVFKTGKMAILTWLNYFIGVNAGAPNGISSSCSTCGAFTNNNEFTVNSQNSLNTDCYSYILMLIVYLLYKVAASNESTESMVPSVIKLKSSLRTF
jgi:hypothetical protein